MGEKTLVIAGKWDKKDFCLQDCLKNAEHQGVEKVALKTVLPNFPSTLNVKSTGTIFYAMVEMYISGNPNIPCFDITEKGTSTRTYPQTLVPTLDILKQNYSGQEIDD